MNSFCVGMTRLHRARSSAALLYMGSGSPDYKAALPKGSGGSGRNLGRSATRIARQAHVAQIDHFLRFDGAQVLGFACGIHGRLLALLQGFVAQFGAMAFEFCLLAAGCHGSGSLVLAGAGESSIKYRRISG
jgi:hypothetical protein